MIKHHFIQSVIFIFLLLILPFSSALALSTGTGTFDVGAEFIYNSDSLEFFNGRTSLETWTIARINVPYQSPTEPYVELDDENYSVYGDASIPGWERAPEDSSVSYGDSAVTITNDHSDAMRPEGHATLTMSTDGSPGGLINTYAAVMYFANIRALDNGSFTFFVDYDAEIMGATTDTGEYVNIAASAQLSLYTMIYDDEGLLQWGNDGSTVESYNDARWLQGLDGDSVSIDDFNSQLALTVNYETGDMFRVRFDGQSSIKGYSEDFGQDPVAPVPEPSTILLLGSGLLGLCWFGRKRKTV